MKTLMLSMTLAAAPILMAQSSANLAAGPDNPAAGHMAPGTVEHLMLEFAFTPTATSVTDPIIDTIVVYNSSVATAMTAVLDNVKLWRVDLATGQPVLVQVNDQNSALALGPTAAYFTGMSEPANTIFRVTGDVKASAAQGGWVTLRVDRPGSFFCSSGSISGGLATLTGGSQTVSTATPPAFTTAGTLPPTTAGVQYQAQFAATGGNPGYTYSSLNLPAGWSLAAGGTLTIPVMVSTTGTHDFDVTVEDSVGLMVTDTFTLVVNAPPAISGPSMLPGGLPGEDYSHQFAATGGTPALVWTAGLLPLGWSLSASGELAFDFVDAFAGDYTIDVTVQDSIGVSDQRTFTLRIANPPVGSDNSSSSGGCVAGASGPLACALLPLLLVLRARRRTC